jgi:hypothetical protein
MYMQQAQQLLALLDTYHHANSGEPAGPPVDTDAVLRAFQKAVQIMQTSSQMESSLGGLAQGQGQPAAAAAAAAAVAAAAQQQQQLQAAAGALEAAALASLQPVVPLVSPVPSGGGCP